jgi:hypothetical protein
MVRPRLTYKYYLIFQLGPHGFLSFRAFLIPEYRRITEWYHSGFGGIQYTEYVIHLRTQILVV